MEKQEILSSPVKGTIAGDSPAIRSVQEQLKNLRQIYDALGDITSQNIYRHRLLYSLTGDTKEITKLVYKNSCAAALLQQYDGKVCYYGAGAGCKWIAQDDRNARFIIDKYKTGTLGTLPIISLDDFLKMPDHKEYLIIVTIGQGSVREEISAELNQLGLNYRFGYNDLLYIEQQYFDLPYLNLHDEYFVDAGAFDGKTTKNFLDRFQNCYAYVLEPNPTQFGIVQDTLRHYQNVELFPYGAYDENTTLRFEVVERDESSGKVSEDGNIEIEVRRLDDLLGNRKVTFIKMDIEGSELAALRGAERIIREQRPKLAICVYHKPEDMWEIPSLILQYNPDYKLYLRHYSITWSETVLYAV